MADRFIEQSKEIANNFIQNIVFIDDKAYKNDMTNNAFSALDVSNVFAQSGKICAVYAPKSISDVNSYNTILNKADVCKFFNNQSRKAFIRYYFIFQFRIMCKLSFRILFFSSN